MWKVQLAGSTKNILSNELFTIPFPYSNRKIKGYVDFQNQDDGITGTKIIKIEVPLADFSNQEDFEEIGKG